MFLILRISRRENQTACRKMEVTGNFINRFIWLVNRKVGKTCLTTTGIEPTTFRGLPDALLTEPARSGRFEYVIFSNWV